MLRREKYDVIFHTRILSEHLIKTLSYSWVISLRELGSSMLHSGFSLQERFFNDFCVQLRRRKKQLKEPGITERKGVKNAFFSFLITTKKRKSWLKSSLNIPVKIHFML